MNSFEKFGEAFQTKIIYHIVTDKAFALQVLDILEPEYFTDENYTQLVTEIKGWEEKHNGIPSFDNLETLVRIKYKDEIEQKYLIDLITAIRSGINVSDKSFVEEETLRFCKNMAVRNSMIECVDYLKKEDYDSMRKSFEAALMAGQSKDFGSSFIDGILSRSVKSRNPISTGFKLIDENIAGGLSSGEVGLVLAGTNVGKSMVLVHLAAEGLKQKKKVLYYTLEMDEDTVMYRLESKFTKLKLTSLLMDSESKLRPKVNKILTDIKEEFDGADIIVKHYPTKSASVNNFRNHLNVLQAKEFVPDLIIVDYVDIIKPISRYNEKRFELESVAEELRGLAGERKIPIWSATQSNRDGLDTSLVSLKTISEALSKAMVVDLVMSIGRTPELVALKRACYYLAKNRNGPSKLQFFGGFDTDIVDFTVDTIGEEDHAGNKMEKKNINDVVKQFMSEDNEKDREKQSKNLLDLIDGLDLED